MWPTCFFNLPAWFSASLCVHPARLNAPLGCHACRYFLSTCESSLCLLSYLCLLLTVRLAVQCEVRPWFKQGFIKIIRKITNSEGKNGVQKSFPCYVEQLSMHRELYLVWRFRCLDLTTDAATARILDPLGVEYTFAPTRLLTKANFQNNALEKKIEMDFIVWRTEIKSNSLFL
jgi:hypothetical protein